MRWPTADESVGLVLACTSSAFIGASFVIKKRGLRIARESGDGANDGGYGYLKQPVWWIGLLTMVVGEAANFIAYAFAPPIFVTPLGALTIIVSAVLAKCCLSEILGPRGWGGCLLCILGSAFVVLSAPQEPEIDSAAVIFRFAAKPPFLIWAAGTFGISIVLACFVTPKFAAQGQRLFKELIVLVLICALMGSMSVLSCKALGLSIRMLFSGQASEVPPLQALVSALLVVVCIVVQMNYLNKALDVFDTAKVSPVYYVLFTTFTLAASFILFEDWERVQPGDTAATVLGMLAVAAGVKFLHSDIAFQEQKRVGSQRNASMHTTSSFTSGAPFMATSSWRHAAVGQPASLAIDGLDVHLAECPVIDEGTGLDRSDVSRAEAPHDEPKSLSLPPLETEDAAQSSHRSEGVQSLQ